MRFRAMPLYHVRPATGRARAPAPDLALLFGWLLSTEDFPRPPLRNWDRLFREVRAFFPAVGRPVGRGKGTFGNSDSASPITREFTRVWHLCSHLFAYAA